MRGLLTLLSCCAIAAVTAARSSGPTWEHYLRDLSRRSHSGHNEYGRRLLLRALFGRDGEKTSQETSQTSVPENGEDDVVKATESPSANEEAGKEEGTAGEGTENTDQVAGNGQGAVVQGGRNESKSGETKEENKGNEGETEEKTEGPVAQGGKEGKEEGENEGKEEAKEEEKGKGHGGLVIKGGGEKGEKDATGSVIAQGHGKGEAPKESEEQEGKNAKNGEVEEEGKEGGSKESSEEAPEHKPCNDNGKVYQHREEFKHKCNTCICLYGNIACTLIHCG